MNFAVLFLLALATHHKISLHGFGHNTLELQPHDTVEATVTDPGLTLLIPHVEGFFVDVYQRGSDANILAGSLTPKGSAFGAFFPRDGFILIKASAPTTLTYFTFDNPRECVRFFVTTSGSDHFSAVQALGAGNLTIQNSQRVCVLHVSDDGGDVNVKYSTEEDYDMLYFRSNAAQEHVFSGIGTHNESNVKMSQFIWASDKAILSDYFDIHWNSNSSFEPMHANFSAQWESAAPEIIYDYVRGASATPKMEYENARVNWYARTDNEVVVNIIIMSVVGMFLMLVLILLGMFCWKWQKQVCAPMSTEADGSLVEMLNALDAAGVNRDAEARETGHGEALPAPLNLDVSEIDEIIVEQ